MDARQWIVPRPPPPPPPPPPLPPAKPPAARRSSATRPRDVLQPRLMVDDGVHVEAVQLGPLHLRVARNVVHPEHAVRRDVALRAHAARETHSVGVVQHSRFRPEIIRACRPGPCMAPSNASGARVQNAPQTSPANVPLHRVRGGGRAKDEAGRALQLHRWDRVVPVPPGKNALAVDGRGGDLDGRQAREADDATKDDRAAVSAAGTDCRGAHLSPCRSMRWGCTADAARLGILRAADAQRS
eukprot:scaffold1309_cov117-Isochrysis_galbana.AAC.18